MIRFKSQIGPTRPEWPGASLRLEDFDFELPGELVAKGPPPNRGEGRLLVLERRTGRISHRNLGDLREVLQGEMVYVNNSKVRRSWMLLQKVMGHLHWVFLIRALGDRRRWLAYFPIPREFAGSEFRTKDGIKLLVGERISEDRWVLEFESEPDLSRFGEHCLSGLRPPANDEERKRYEPLYARVEGSFMSPSAGVNLSGEILDRLKIRELTLHIQTNTRYQVREGALPELESEYYEVPEPPEAPAVAIGTTVAKALETWARTGERRGWSDLLITPPFPFRAIKALLTNFHRPRETLLMLACAFGGRDWVMSAYREAVREGYRFSDYGDSMLMV